VLLQAADLSVQAFQRVGMLSLQKQQVLLGTLQLVLQVWSRHPDVQLPCQ